MWDVPWERPQAVNLKDAKELSEALIGFVVANVHYPGDIYMFYGSKSKGCTPQQTTTGPMSSSSKMPATSSASASSGAERAPPTSDAKK